MAEIKLTPAQWAAVHTRGSNLLVSAAAGSGKTKVLVDRLMDHLLEETNPANIDDFLLITYTKAAAGELRSKISQQLSELLAKMPENRHLQRQMQRIYLANISTVHAFCGDLLREYAYLLGLPGDFRVVDEAEALELRQTAMDAVLEEAYDGIDGDEDLQAFVNTLGLGRDDRAVPELVAQVYDSARCHLRPMQWLSDCEEKNKTGMLRDASETPWGGYLVTRFREFLAGEIRCFEGLCRRAGMDDSLLKAQQVLEQNLNQLRTLYEQETWDGIWRGKILDFGRMATVKNPGDPERWEQMKAIRTESWKDLKAWQERFYGDSAQVLGDLEQTGMAVSGLFSLVRKFDSRFRAEKERRRVLDFGDLEHHTVTLLLGKHAEAPTAAAREIGQRFREVLVDEYQDTNRVQDSIFAAITNQRSNLFLVGDVKQSIYRFRLADPGIFREKSDAYLPLEQEGSVPGRKIHLSENFRSGGAVLAAANDVFSCAMSRAMGGVDYDEQEALREGVPHEPLSQPEVELHCLNLAQAPEGTDKDEAEANYIARRIRDLLDGGTCVREGGGLRPVRPEDIVILLRSPGTIAPLYLQAMARLGIPAQAAGSSGSLLEAPEICVLRAILQVIDNPRQDIPLLAALSSPVFGFTADRLASIRGENRRGCFYDALRSSTQEEAVQFCRTLGQLRSASKLDTLAALVQRIFRETSMDTIYRAGDQGEERVENLRSFYEIAAGFEERGRKDLSQFLEYLDSQEERGLERSRENGTAGAVQIMSIHKSKGLEFPVVILANLSRRFNLQDLQQSVLTDPELGVGCGVVDFRRRVRYPTIAKIAIGEKLRRESRSEELRVLYVAMTRAKDMLIMTYASKYLAGELKTIAGEMELPASLRLSGKAGCLGHWVLMNAITRTEAGSLHRLAGRPEELAVRDRVWNIRLVEDPALWSRIPGRLQDTTIRAEDLPVPDAGDLAAMGAEYPHGAAALAPSKMTATQLKGRELDREAAESAPAAPVPQPRWRRPAFLQQQPPLGREIGTATHLVMQFIRYECCGSAQEIRDEVTRLVEQEYLTARQGEAVDQGKILRFFSTELGLRLRQGTHVRREFKFSILEPGEHFDPRLAGEEIMLQGVVDCFLLEEDGITILDFKTDRVGPEGGASLVERYGPQVRAYGKALSRIFEKPVKAMYLYLFDPEELVEVRGGLESTTSQADRNP